MRFLWLFLLLGVALEGCGKGKKQEQPATPQSNISGTATIQGIVKFVGTPPIMKPIPNAVCAGTHESIKEQTIEVGQSGGLQNCIVYLKGITGGAGNPASYPVLDQLHCQFVPHVLAVQVGQPLVIRSSDDTPHDVHMQTQVNTPENYSFVKAGQQCVVKFAYPEIFHVACDVHPWMSAWIGVFPNPYFAVTDANGHFEIKDVPAGKYTLEVWQESLGQQDATITIAVHQTIEQNFTYAPTGTGSP